MGSTTACSINCSADLSTQLGRLDSPKERAEKYLVREGYVRRRTKLKNLSVKKIIEIVEALESAKSYMDNHECRGYFDD